MWNLSSLTRDWTHTPFIRRQSPFPRLSRKSQMDPSFLNLHSWLISLLVLLTLCYKTRFSSAQSVSCVWLFATPWTAARQASLFITNSRSLLKLMSIKSVMPSNHLILCRPLLLPPPVFPSIRVFSNESVLCIRWPKYWSFSFTISPSNEHPGLISFRMDWLDLLAVQGTLKSLPQHHSWKASILWRSAFFKEKKAFLFLKESWDKIRKVKTHLPVVNGVSFYVKTFILLLIPF